MTADALPSTKSSGTVRSEKPLRLNLGCGALRVPGFVGVDLGISAATDVRMDVYEYLRSLPDRSVTEIYSRHFFEHVDSSQMRALLSEVDRVLKPGGRLRVIVPHFSNPYYNSDPTHRSPFGVHTFSYFCETTCLTRETPAYVAISGWTLYRVKVGFRPFARPKVFGLKLPVLSDLLNTWINTAPLTVELFERYLSSVLSIYEVEFFVRKDDGGRP